jgi:glycosyltransferase involved in cell wall biosynthesis
MKVLFIARRFPPSVGGMERFAFDLAGALEKQHRLDKITWGGSNKWLPIMLPTFFLRACLKLLRHSDTDVIHMQDAVQAPIGWLLGALFGKPYIVVAHGLDITYQSKFYQAVILPFVRRADMVVSISTATQDEVIKRGVNPDKACVITLGTHDDYEGGPVADRAVLMRELNVDIPSTRKLLLTTGRLVKRKGVEWFIRNVLPELTAYDKEILYLVAGDGAEREAIEKAIRESGMERNVCMLGRVSESARKLLYQSCDVFVMPNIKVSGDMEGFGIVAHEAATAGVPVVASNMEGIADALHANKNGLLVRSGAKDEFIHEITTLLADEKKRKSFGEAARRYTLREFSWERIAEKYRQVYDTVIK